MSTPTTIITIERELLLTDLHYRVAFDRDFVGFSEVDEKVLHDAAPLVLPLVKTIVDGVFDHLFKYTYTKQAFLKRNVGFEGDVAKTLDELTVDDPQMKFRRSFLQVYVTKIFTADFDDPATWEYLDNVGVLHTGAPGFKHRVNKDPLKVDLQALSLTLGWVVDLVLSVVLTLPEDVLSQGDKAALSRAFNKIIWIQQDLFARHYARSDEESEVHLSTVLAASEGGIVSEKALHAQKQSELENATTALPTA
ncbi:hypothetical protein RQP46_006640 [Phenoliferia psychrophenolica]